MRLVDGMLARGKLKILVIFILILIPLLLSGLATSEASLMDDVIFKEPHVSLDNSVLIVGRFHYFDVILEDDRDNICIIAYVGDSLPDFEDRSYKNYYRWEYDNGAWKDIGGHESSYIDSSKCQKENHTYSFYIGIDSKADKGQWTIKIIVDNEEMSSTPSFVVVADFGFFLSAMIGVFEPRIRDKNPLFSSKFICSDRKRIMVESEKNIEERVDEILRKHAASDQEESADKTLDLFVSDEAALPYDELVTSTVSTYSKSRLKKEQSNALNSLFFNKKLGGGNGFWPLNLDGNKKILTIILTIILLSASFSLIIISKNNVVESDGNLLVEQTKLTVPSLLEQACKHMIKIDKVEHLDQNRSFVSNISNEVESRDDMWSESINHGEYVRVTFEQSLNKDSDIAIYAGSEGISKIEVYIEDNDGKITTFENITSKNWYKVYLTNLSGSHDTFDLRIMGDSVVFDFIADPPPVTSVDFIDPYIQTVSPATITATESSPTDNITLYYRWSDDNSTWSTSWSTVFNETWSSGTDGNYEGDDDPDPDGDSSDMWWYINDYDSDLTDIMVGNYGNTGEETDCIYFRDNDHNQYGEPRDSGGAYWNASGSGWVDGYINFTYDYYVDDNEGVNLDVWRGSGWTNVWSDINTAGRNQEAADPGWATASYQLVAADLAAEEFSFRIELVGVGAQGDTNPDTGSPWSWSFDFPNGTGYYEFYSIGKKSGETDEEAPTSADAICNFNSSLNSVPTQMGEMPSNGSTNIELTPTLNVTIDDPDKNVIMAYWYSNSSGSWEQFGINSSVSTQNGSVNISQTNSNFTDKNKTYWWSLNLTDTLGWTNQTYYFTTRSNYTPNPPIDFTATTNGRFQVDLGWTDHAYSDSTRVEWNAADDPTWNIGDHNLLYNGSSGSTSHTGLEPSNTRFYKAWSFNATDGVWGAGSTDSNTTADNNPPNYGVPDPANGSTDQPTILTWSIEITDIDGDTFNWTIECNNGQNNSANNDNNGTKQLSLSGLDYSTEYIVRVNTTDSYNWTREWYNFTTEEATNSPTVGSEYPLNESTGIAIVPELSVIVDDANDDILNATWFSNSSGTWIQFGENLSIDPGSGPVTIRQTNINFSLHNKTYWWSVNVTDGLLWTNQTYHFKTNIIPTQNGEAPANDSSGTNILPSLHVICSDEDNDIMTAYWYSNSSGPWSLFATNSSVSSGTNITQTNSNFSYYETTYWWSVNLTDGKDWKNHTYHLTTGAVPVLSNPFPSNGSVGISLKPICNLTVSDQDGGTVNVSFYENATGPWILRQTNESVDVSSPTNVVWNKYNNAGTRDVTYWWKANVTDSAGISTEEIYHFTTTIGSKPTVSLVNPSPNATAGIGILPTCRIWANDSDGDTLTVYWYENTTGDYTLRATYDNNVTANTTTNYTFSQFNDYYTTYYWKVIVNDSYDETSAIYHFTTTENMNTAVGDIVPYGQTTSPKTLTATASGGIPDNVTLYYRWSDDNVTWEVGGWDTLFYDDFEDNTYGNYSEDDADGDVALNSASWVDGTYSVYLRDDTGANLYLTDTILADTNGYSQIKVEFSFVVDDFNNPGTEDWWFQYYNGSSGSWETVYDYDCGVGTYIDQNVDTNWDTNGIMRHGFYFNESEGWSLSDDFKVRFYCDASGNADDLYVDTIYINATTGGTGFNWTEWSNSSNPDTGGPWSWDFDFPDGEGYYGFYSIGKKAGFSDELAPSSADAICKYNLAPTLTGEGPSDGSSDISIAPILNVTVNDNDELTAYWYSNSSGSWTLFATNGSIDTSGGAVNITQNNANFSQWGNTYWWSLNVTDGLYWTNDTYQFTTSYLPNLSNPNPSNGSNNQNIMTICNITVSDLDGGTVDVNFYENTTGSWVLQQTNSSVDVTSPANVQWNNYNNASSYGTNYWWKVNITDSKGLSIEEIYHFTTSHIPSLSDPDPPNGTSSEPPAPICIITVSDQDGGTVDVNFYENTTGSWVLQQTNSSVDVTSPANVQWNNYNNASVKSTKYWWKVNVTDSKGLSSANIYHFTTATADPPKQSYEIPADLSTNVNISITTINVTIEDQQGDPINWTIETSPNIGSQDNSSSSEGNGSKVCSVSGLTYGTTYTWYVNASDDIDWSNETYVFTTGFLPETNNPGPSNGSTGQSLTPVCNVTVSDQDGGTVDVYFYDNSTGPGWILRQTNSSVDVTTPVNIEWDKYDGASSYDTAYWWKVNVTDSSGYSIEKIYHFTTEPISTSVDTISPHHVKLSPFIINATSHTTVDNITMYYRWSQDNISWGEYKGGNTIFYESFPNLDGGWAGSDDGDTAQDEYWIVDEESGDPDSIQIVNSCQQGVSSPPSGNCLQWNDIDPVNFAKGDCEARNEGNTTWNPNASGWKNGSIEFYYAYFCDAGEGFQFSTWNGSTWDVQFTDLSPAQDTLQDWAPYTWQMPDWVFDSTEFSFVLEADVPGPQDWLYADEISMNVSLDGFNWTIWSDPSNPDENSPWSWNFVFPDGIGYYEFYSIGRMSGETDEIAPAIADATCYYNNLSRPIINSYDLRNNTGSKLNNATGLLDINQEYIFQINITESNGWENIEFVNISAWYDNGSDATTYNQSDNLGGNLNMKLQYKNTTGTAVYSMLWPDDESQIVLGNCTETIINKTTRIINISFVPGSQIRWAGGDGGWDTTKNLTNDQYSWNFNITVKDEQNKEILKKDEYGVYRYISIQPISDWVDVHAAPGTSDDSSVVTITYSSNYDFNMSVYFEENLTNTTWAETITIADNVDIKGNTDPNDDITEDITFQGIGEENAVDIFNISGVFYSDDSSQTVNVQFNVYIPFGTHGGKYTARVATKIVQD